MAGAGDRAPSTNIRNLNPNLESLDAIINSDAPTIIARETPDNPTGKVIRTIAGFNADAQQAINDVQASGAATIAEIEELAQVAVDGVGYDYLDPLTFETGATITNANQALLWATADGGNDSYYRWSGALPKTVPPGSTPADSGGVATGAWRFLGDAALRSELADPDKGAAMVARGVVSVSTIDDLKSLPETQIKEGLTYLVQGYFSPGDGGGGEFRWNPESTSDEDGGLVLKSAYKNTGAWERLYSTPLNVNWFGVFPSSGDVSEAVNLIFELGKDTFFPSGVYIFNSRILANGIRILGESGTVFQKGPDTLGVSMASFYDCEVRNIEWDGNKENIAGYPGDPTVGSLLVVNKSNISDCVFYGTESSCIAGSVASDVIIDRCHFSDFDDHAVYFSTRSKNISLLNSSFGLAPSTTRATIQFRSGCENVTVDNCHQDYEAFNGINNRPFLAVWNGTQSHGTTKNIIINNCSYNTSYQLYFYSDFEDDHIENVVISNCRFVGDNTQPCFNFTHRSETIIKNFTVENSVFYDYTHARFLGTSSRLCERITISNCKFKLSGDSYLLYFAQSNFVYMTNCYVEGSTNSDSASFIIIGTRCHDLSVIDSYFKEAGTGSIVGLTFSPSSLRHAVSLTKIIGNTFDCTNHVISAGEPDAAPLGRVLYRDNSEINDASDLVGEDFEPTISVINRYRIDPSRLLPITVHNSLI